MALSWHKFVQACKEEGNPNPIIPVGCNVAEDIRPTPSYAAGVSVSPIKTIMEERLMY